MSTGLRDAQANQRPDGGRASDAERSVPLIWAARILKAVGGALVVVAAVTFLAFLLSYLSPTDPASQYFSAKGVAPSAEELAAKRHELGLDRGFLEQYLSWIVGVVNGDLGESYKSGRSVAGALLEALPYTLALTGATLAFTLAVSVPVGLACAYRKDGVFDNIVRALSYFFNSLPAFFVALMLLYFLSLRFHWFLVHEEPGPKGLVMPVLALSIPLLGWYVRQIRSIALEQLGQDYVTGLRSRGVSEASILCKHVLRGSLAPILTLVGVSGGSLLGGSAIVENIFDWPGIGAVSISAIGSRDYLLIQGYALVMALCYLLVNALVDLACRIIDPRSRRKA